MTRRTRRVQRKQRRPAAKRIGILGSGLMGGKLGTLFARAGHEVVFSYSHSQAKLRRLARNARGFERFEKGNS